MNLYNKKFVHFEWDDELKSKKVITSVGIDSLIAQVNRGTSSTVLVRENPDSEFPFYEIDSHRIYRFAYYDPNYECKRAYAEGKQIQLKSYGKWHDITDPSWSDGEEYRIKPEEPKSRRMTYRELAEWLAKGNGQYSLETNIVYNMVTAYDLSRENVEIGKEYKIRRWSSDEWIEPTVDVYEADCGKAEQFLDEEYTASNECQDCVKFDEMPNGLRCKTCDNGSHFQKKEEAE